MGVGASAPVQQALENLKRLVPAAHAFRIYPVDPNAALAQAVLNANDRHELFSLSGLSIDENSTSAEVKRAYHKLASKIHPDKLIGRVDLATRAFQELQRVYEGGAIDKGVGGDEGDSGGNDNDGDDDDGAQREWQPAAEPETLASGAPKQVLRAASPEFMRWLLRKLGELGADVETLTTHDAVHGLGAKWDATRHKATGFGYGAPTSPACIRAITAPGQTSLYYFLTQHPAGEALRTELVNVFGPEWASLCFGLATHFLCVRRRAWPCSLLRVYEWACCCLHSSHSWRMPFSGFINALGEVPEGSFVCNLPPDTHALSLPHAASGMASGYV